MSTPCYKTDVSRQLFSGWRNDMTDRVEHAAKSLELRLDVVFFALELGDGELSDAPVCGRGGSGPRGDRGSVEVAHI